MQGDPGSEKTTLSLQFLFEGLPRGEKVLYITLSETKADGERDADFCATAHKEVFKAAEMNLCISH